MVKTHKPQHVTGITSLSLIINYYHKVGIRPLEVLGLQLLSKLNMIIRMIQSGRLFPVEFVRPLLTALLLAASSLVQAELEPSPVAEVTLVLGASVVRQQYGSEGVQIHRGDLIYVGDRIETRSNGHVHLRFRDDALVSVRPNSRLNILRYDYDPNRPSESTIKFELEEGVTRAISGRAAKEARDRFRLNTPIAAIGVRGTDFVVSAGVGSTRAKVNEGAIVMAPFSEVCSADGIGPCASNALELAGGALGLAALDQSAPLPRLIPAQSVRTPDFMQAEVQRAAASSGSQLQESAQAAIAPENSESSKEQEVNNEVLLEGVTTVKVRVDAEVAAGKVEDTDFIPSDPIALSDDGALVGFNYTPPELLTSEQLSRRQLVWGRYFGEPTLLDRLTLTFEEASQSRSAAIGTLEFGLFRSESNGRAISSEAGLVGFRLTSAQAVYNSQTGIIAMAVNEGSLDINFQDNSFSTFLTLNSDTTGIVDFMATGKLFDGGFLRALEATQSVRGAVSFDTTEAGYQFVKNLPLGTVSGLTLWDSK